MQLILVSALLVLISLPVQAQINNRNPYGMGSVAQPTGQEQRPEEPKTVEEIMDEFMPSLTDALALNEFDQAVMRSILTKYLQKRMEVQILELPPDQTREAFEKIAKEEDEELKYALSEDLYKRYNELKEQGPDWKRKANRDKKRKKKKEELDTINAPEAPEN